MTESAKKKRDDLVEHLNKTKQFFEVMDYTPEKSFSAGFDQGYAERDVEMAIGTTGMIVKTFEDREAKLVEALRFYAYPNNWIEIDGTDGVHEQIADDSTVHINGYSLGGKRARQTLKECGYDL